MVDKLAEIEPRSSGETVVTNDETGEDFFRPTLPRSVWIFDSSLDEYAEVTVTATHSADEAFDNALTNKQGVPVRPGKSREVAYTDSNELVKFTVDTPTAPTSGSLTIWREEDRTPLPLQSSELMEFHELNEGRIYASDFQESLADDGTLTAGIRNPSSSGTSIFIKQFGISVGGDALVTSEIDHDSYTDGTDVPVINNKPELQVERPISASVSQDPTISTPQESMTTFLPGGVGGASTGARFKQPDYEISPGQDLTVELQNVSGGTNRYGFSLELIETVVR